VVGHSKRLFCPGYNDASVTNATLILASRSARRAQLLQQAGYRFVQVTPPFHDPPQPRTPTTERPDALAANLALQKACSLVHDNSLSNYPDAVILAADTIAVSPAGALLGQPHNRDHAQQMLGMLINATHRVYTGVAIVDHNGDQVVRPFADWAQVQFGIVPQAQLITYLASRCWQGKAGGYHLFDLNPDWPWSVVGDPATVVGLPLKKLTPHLAPWSTLQPATGDTTSDP